MKRMFAMGIVILATVVICVYGLATLIKDSYEPKLSQSSEYNGVLVMNDIENEESYYVNAGGFESGEQGLIY